MLYGMLPCTCKMPQGTETKSSERSMPMDVNSLRALPRAYGEANASRCNGSSPGIKKNLAAPLPEQNVDCRDSWTT